MKSTIDLRHWFSEHTFRVCIIFAAIYQLIDMLLNYFISRELDQGISNFYQSAGGKEDLLRLFVVLSLFALFARFSRDVILDLRRAQQDEARHLNEVKHFAYSVMHDVKNPAIGAHSMAMLFRKKYGEIIDDQGEHYLDIMEQSSKDIVAMMEQVDIFIKSREYALNFERVDVQNGIDLIHEAIRSLLDARSIKWFQQPEKFPHIYADKLAIHRIFRNLIDNAIKYGGEGLDEIIIEYQSNETFHIFYVSDNGCGIDEYDQEHIFEVFKRTKASGGVEGLGLGLAIVKELVAKHNGSIFINSMPEKGTAFMFTVSKSLQP